MTIEWEMYTPDAPNSHTGWHIVHIEDGDDPILTVFHPEGCPTSLAYQPKTVTRDGTVLSEAYHYTRHECMFSHEYEQGGTYGMFGRHTDKVEAGWWAMRPWVDVGIEIDGGWETKPLAALITEKTADV